MPEIAKPRTQREKDALIRAGQVYLSQNHLSDFVLLMYSVLSPNYPDTKALPKHVLYWADLLEKMERYEIKKIAISGVPGHFKSSIAIAFSAWFLGKRPSRRIMYVSFEEKLVLRNSGIVRNMVTSPQWPWPEIKLNTKSLEMWSTAQGGGILSIGKSGTATGHRNELIILDDIQKDAGTEKSREDDWELFQNILLPRLEPNPNDGLMVILANRYHDQDIIGRIESHPTMSKEWLTVNIPAIAEEGDLLGRKPGEALWPEKSSIEILNKEKERLGPVAFSGIYQCRPVPTSGNLFRPEWFEHRYEGAAPMGYFPEVSESERLLRIYAGTASTPLHKPFWVIQAVDSAWKTGKGNDRSAIITMSGDGKNIYVVDLWYGKLEFPDLRKKLVEEFDKYHPSRVYVEEAASGYALIQDLKAATPLPIVAVKPGSDAKVARIEATTGLWEAGRIFLPKNDPWWMPEFRNEHLRVPYGQYDDICDATALGVRMLRQLQASFDAMAMEEYADQISDWMAR